jgi:hypothetical protein
MIYIIEDADLDVKKGLSILYFYYPDMLLYKRMIYHLEGLEANFRDVKLYAVDISIFPYLGERYELSSVPALVLLKDGGVYTQSAENIFKCLAFIQSFDKIYSKYNKKIRKTNVK